MQSFVDLDKTFRSQPRALGAVLARIDTGRGQERLFEDQRPELLGRPVPVNENETPAGRI